MQAIEQHDLIQRLYQDHQLWLQAWLRRKLGNPTGAADLAQDTFLTLLLSHPRAAGLPDDHRTWFDGEPIAPQ